MVGSHFATLEKEIVALSAVWELIEAMVNYEIFAKNPTNLNTTLRFNSDVCSKLFLVILSDFLSVPKEGAFGLPKLKERGSAGCTHLGLLLNVSKTPTLGNQPDVIADSAKAFVNWLDDETTVKNVWLPSIEVEADLRIRRLDYLKICGSISKHGFARSDHPVSKIGDILGSNGVTIERGEAYLAIPDFRVWFSQHVFLCHATLIAMFLNEIRWAIFEYLQPEFQRAYRKTIPIGAGQFAYEYDVPKEVDSSLTSSMYWNLMNSVRCEPFFPRFTTNSSLASQF